jgi:hypothetical protein
MPLWNFWTIPYNYLFELPPWVLTEKFTANHIAFMHKILCIISNILYVAVAAQEMLLLIFNFVINPKWQVWSKMHNWLGPIIWCIIWFIIILKPSLLWYINFVIYNYRKMLIDHCHLESVIGGKCQEGHTLILLWRAWEPRDQQTFNAKEPT